MKSSQSYTFSFLTSEEIDEHTVRDINGLLGQLTSRTEAKIDHRKLALALKSDMRMMVARHGSTVVGMGIICRVPRLTCKECEIHDVVVDSFHRGKGIAGEILSQLIAEGRSRYSADQINLTSRPDRSEANRLYKNRGFVLRETNCYRLTL